MIPLSLKTTAGTLSVLFLLWNLNGCAQTATQSRPTPEEGPGKAASAPPSVHEAPEEVEAPFPTGPESQAEIGLPAPAVHEIQAEIELPLRPVPEPLTETHAPVPPAPEDRTATEAVGPARAEAPEPVQALPSKPEPPSFVHVVRWEGETLSGIAEWYTGSWKKWKAIARANSRIDPERIQLGNRIQIPESLLKTHEPMPRALIPVGERQEKTARSSPARVRRERPERGPVTEAPPSGEEHRALSGTIERVQAGPGSDKPRAVPEPVDLFGPGEITESPETIREKTELFGPVE